VVAGVLLLMLLLLLLLLLFFLLLRISAATCTILECPEFCALPHS
jgi:hypothetical protein